MAAAHCDQLLSSSWLVEHYLEILSKNDNLQDKE